jgi:hypothetical protein
MLSRVAARIANPRWAATPSGPGGKIVLSITPVVGAGRVVEVVTRAVSFACGMATFSSLQPAIASITNAVITSRFIEPPFDLQAQGEMGSA